MPPVAQHTSISVFMLSSTTTAWPGATTSPGATSTFQTLPGTGAFHRRLAAGQGRLRLGRGHRRIGAVVGDIGCKAKVAPALTLCLEGGLPACLEGRDRRGIGGQKGAVISQTEGAVLYLQLVAAVGKGVARLGQFPGTDRKEADLIKEAQQPGLAAGEACRLVVGIPHLHGAPDELVAAGAFHAIDAHIGAADAHRVFRRPGTGRIVFGGHKAMARVEGVATGAPR
jgi:hypothetical protein